MVKAKTTLFKREISGKSARGQSMVEMALLFPVLLIMLSGLIEFGFILNQYLTIMDAARNAARFASDGLYYQWDNVKNCSTSHFYRQTACLVNQELSMEAPAIQMNDNGTPHNTQDDFLDPTEGNDIIISVFSFTRNQGITNRHPGGNESGWSYAVDLDAVTDKSSHFSSLDVTDSMVDLNSPNTGYILVEIFYNYEHTLGLPWITAVLDDPLLLHAYAFMPLTSAEPTPTVSP
jgi:hypothetical protein